MCSQWKGRSGEQAAGLFHLYLSLLVKGKALGQQLEPLAERSLERRAPKRHRSARPF